MLHSSSSFCDGPTSLSLVLLGGAAVLLSPFVVALLPSSSSNVCAHSKLAIWMCVIHVVRGRGEGSRRSNTQSLRSDRVSRSKARVMYLRLTTTSPGREFNGVPATIFSALSFQRLPSNFRRTGRASTAPVSNPTLCSSLRSDFPSQITVRQRSSSFVRSAVLGSFFQIAFPNMDVCVHVPGVLTVLCCRQLSRRNSSGSIHSV